MLPIDLNVLRLSLVASRGALVSPPTLDTPSLVHSTGVFRVRANAAGIRIGCRTNPHPTVRDQILPETRFGHRSPHPHLDPPCIPHEHRRTAANHHRGHPAIRVLGVFKSGGWLFSCALESGRTRRKILIDTSSRAVFALTGARATDHTLGNCMIYVRTSLAVGRLGVVRILNHCNVDWVYRWRYTGRGPWAGVDISRRSPTGWFNHTTSTLFNSESSRRFF